MEKRNDKTISKLDPNFLLFQNPLPEGVSIDDSLYVTFSNLKRCRIFPKVERTPEDGVL